MWVPQDLPALYLRGGSIIPFGPAHQHVGEANPNDDLSLLVALDENGNPLFYFSLLICKYNAQVVTAGTAEGVMFEDDGESYEYINGVYLLTAYVAELRSSVITVSVSKIEGLWKRPNRRLHVHILLGEGAMVCLLFLYIPLYIFPYFGFQWSYFVSTGGCMGH